MECIENTMLKCSYADTANCTVRNCKNTLLAVRCQAKHSGIHRRLPLTEKTKRNQRCRYEHLGALLSPQLIIVVGTDTEVIRKNPEECENAATGFVFHVSPRE